MQNHVYSIKMHVTNNAESYVRIRVALQLNGPNLTTSHATNTIQIDSISNTETILYIFCHTRTKSQYALHCIYPHADLAQVHYWIYQFKSNSSCVDAVRYFMLLAYKVSNRNSEWYRVEKNTMFCLEGNKSKSFDIGNDVNLDKHFH